MCFLLQPVRDDRSDPLACAAVAERSARRGGAATVQAPAHRRNDPTRIGSDQLDIAADDGFGPLGLVAKDEQRNAKRGRLFLHPPGIAENQVSAEHRRDRLRMTARLAEGDAALPEKHLADGIGERGVGMKEHLDARERLRCDRPDRGGDPADARAPIFAAVASDKQFWSFTAGSSRGGDPKREHRVDPAVTGDVDPPLNPLAAEVGRAQFGRGEEKFAVAVDRDPELLLGPWTPEIVAPEARFDMGERNCGELGGERTAERA